MLKSFIELTDSEKQQCYELIKEKKKDNTQSFKEFTNYWSGEVVNKGENCIISIDNENINGIIGVVTREVPIRNEAFIFNFYIKDSAEESAKELLRKAVEICIDAKSPIAKLGIKPTLNNQLYPIIIGEGFQSCYEALIMKLTKNDYFSSKEFSKLEFISVADQNKNEYVRIHNNAFRNAPNGSDTSLEELEEMLEERRDKPELIGLAKHNSIYAGIYELDIKEETGWINAVGIHKEYWRMGLGEELVRKCIEMLFSLGVKDIKLIVLSSNERAAKLYKKLGFVKDEIFSTWFVKELN